MNRDNSEGNLAAMTGLVSVEEASRRLGVSESTVWRWIDRGILHAYRVGPKRVRLRAVELGEIVRPDRRKRSVGLEEVRKRLHLVPMSDNPDLDAVERAREFRERLLAERGGVPLPESWPEINEAREQRSRELA